MRAVGVSRRKGVVLCIPWMSNTMKTCVSRKRILLYRQFPEYIFQTLGQLLVWHAAPHVTVLTSMHPIRVHCEWPLSFDSVVVVVYFVWFDLDLERRRGHCDMGHGNCVMRRCAKHQL